MRNFVERDVRGARRTRMVITNIERVAARALLDTIGHEL
jgi:hypothetical protein